MNSIFRFFASRHLLATIFTLALLIGGFTALLTIKKDLFPRVVLNEVAIITVYPGASSEDVELNCTNRIEDGLRTVDGIQEVVSISIEDMSIVKVRIDDDLNKAAADKVEMNIRNAVQQIKDLPSDIDGKPIVNRERGDLLPIITIGIGGDLPYKNLRKAAKKLKKRIKNISAVASVNFTAYRAREVTIELDPKKIELYQVPFIEIIEAIKNRNIRGTAGSLDSYTTSKNIVTLAQYKDPSQVGDVIIRSSLESKAITLKDIAQIKDGFKKQDIITRINGKPVIMMTVNKKEKADIVTTILKIKNKIKETTKDLPEEIKINYSNDLSRYVKASYSVVMSNGITGFVLVIIILTLFLSFRISIWVALGIPISLLGTIIFLPIFGVSLDVVTLSAMILVLGIIVDDAIVIAERIYFHWEKNNPPLEAAVLAMKEVFWPVTTTVVSTLLAFIPMLFIPGDMGKFIMVIPLVIILSLTLSLLEGVIALPAHIAKDLEKMKRSVKKKKKKNKFLAAINSKFKYILSASIKKRYVVLSVFFLVLAGSFIYASTMKNIFLPTEGAEEFAIFIETPSESNLQYTSSIVKKIETIIHNEIKSVLTSWTTIVGNQEGYINKNNIASIRINLIPFSKRKENAEEIISRLKEKIKKVKGISKLVFDVSDSGPSPSTPIHVIVTGEHNKLRKKCADTITTMLKNNKDITGIERDDKKGKEQIEIKLQHSVMSLLGISVADVAATLRLVFDGEIITKVQYGNEQVKFRLIYPQKSIRQKKDILSISVPNKAGRLSPLSLFGKIVKREGNSEYHHYNFERAISIKARISNKELSASSIIDNIINSIPMKQYPGINIVIKGDAKKTQDSHKHFLKIFLLAIIGIYLLLLLLFNSPVQPLIIMMAVPFGLSGVIITFAIHNEPISFFCLLGIVGLSGVVVNDSLLLVDHFNRLLKGEKNNRENNNLIEHIIKGTVERSRAIVMTTITTATGILPLAYGIGGSDPTTAPMALALGWGLIFATPITLILIPCLYVIVLDILALKHRIFDYIKTTLIKRISLFFSKGALEK